MAPYSLDVRERVGRAWDASGDANEVAARSRPFEPIGDWIAAALARFTPDECANDVRQCGDRFTTEQSTMLA